ncbi:MAG: hypothetical protein LBG62_02310 [Candidatus Methanoplasma sp.]|jgi:hypothetical protein|nr:hypothetical protein [Candidatus Methanoplasma sp.]
MNASRERLPLMLAVVGSALVLGGVVAYVGSAIYRMLDSSGEMGLFEPESSRYAAMAHAPEMCAILLAAGALAWAATFWLELSPAK